MDPRVAWFQPEQKGPANALWMRVWETSQRRNHCHQLRVNAPALPVGFMKPLTLIPTNTLGKAVSGYTNQHYNDVAPVRSPNPGPPAPCVTPAGLDGCDSLSPLSSGDSETDSPKSDSSSVTSDSMNTLPAKLHFNFTEHMHNVNNSLQQHSFQRLQTHVVTDNQPKYHPGRKRNDNKASTYGMNYFLSHAGGNYLCGTPWANRRYSSGING